MDSTDEDTKYQRIAMLIDGDNAQSTLMKYILAETGKYGMVTIRRNYGDWTESTMNSWKDTLHTYAILSGADLSGANLYRAKEAVKEITTPLYSLMDQESIRLYKLVTKYNTGPYHGGIVYEVGQEYSVDTFNIDINEQCGSGINVATLDWCLKEYKTGYKILIVEFKPEDIAAIPIGSDGKLRVKRCKVIAEKDITGMV